MHDKSVDSAEYRAMTDARREFYARWGAWLGSKPDPDDVAIETHSTRSVVEQTASLMLESGAAR